MLRKAIQLTELGTQKAVHHNNKQYIQQKLQTAPCSSNVTKNVFTKYQYQ